MDINVLLRRAGLKASEEEIAVLKKDFENIIQMLEQLPEPELKSEQTKHAMHLAKDEPFNDATKEAVLENAKDVEDGMYKIND